MKNFFVACAAVALTSACATVPPPPPEAPVMPPSQAPVVHEQGPTNGPTTEADFDGLQNSIGLTDTDLGLHEKAFNTCTAGYGYSSSHDCRTMYFALVNFQLQCRDSNGTVSDVDYKVTPVVSDHVKWAWGPAQGSTKTDTQGFGRVRGIFHSAAGAQRFRLTVSGDFLILRAMDVRRVVAPKEWCEHR